MIKLVLQSTLLAMLLGLINLSFSSLRKLQNPNVLAGYLSTSRTSKWFGEMIKKYK